LKRRLLVLFILFLLTVLTFGLRLATGPRADRWIRETIVGQVEKRLGIRVVVKDFERNLFLTRVAFSEVSLEDPEGIKGSVSLSRLAVEIDPFGFLRGTIRFNRVFLEGLSLDVVRGRDGRILIDPFPPFNPGGGSGPGRGVPVGIEVGQIQLLNGKVSFFDEPYGLFLKTGDITIALTPKRLISTNSRDISLRTGKGEIDWRGFGGDSGVGFDFLQARLLYDPEELDLDEVRLSGGAVSLELSGRVPLREDGEFSGKAALVLDLGQIPLPREGIGGKITLEGEVGGDPSNPSLTGRMEGQDLSFGERTVERLEANVHVDPLGCSLQKARVLYGGEIFEGDLDLGFAAPYPYRFNAQIQGYPLAEAVREIPGAGLSLAGQVTAKISASGDLSGGDSNLSAAGGVDLVLPFLKEPLQARFGMAGVYGTDGLNDISLSFRTDTLEFQAKGSAIGEGPDLLFSGSEKDLGKWGDIGGSAISGSARVDGRIGGSWKDPRASLDAVLDQPGLGSFAASSAAGHLEVDTKGVTLQSFRLETGGTTLVGEGRYPWGRERGFPVFTAQVTDGEAQDLLEAAGLDPVLTGRLEGRMDGVLRPSGPEADFRIALISGVLYGEGFDRFEGRGALRKDAIEVDRFRIFKGGGSLAGDGSISGGRYRLDFISSDPFSIENVENLRKVKVPLAGKVNISGTVQGGLDGMAPEVQGTLNWDEVSFDGRNWRGGDARLTIREGTLSAEGNLMDGTFSAQAEVDLKEDFPFRGTIRTPGTADRQSLNDLLGVKIPEGTVEGSVSAQAQAQGILANLRQTVVKGTLLTDDLVILGILFRSEESVPFTYYPETGIRFIDANLVSGESDISGTFLITPRATVEGNLDGNIDLRGIAFLRPTVDRFSGQAGVSLQVSGPLADPVLDGTLVFQGVECSAFIPFEMPVRDLQGTLEIVGNRLRTAGVTGTSGGGTLRMEGDLTLERFKPVEGELRWRAESIPVRFPEGLYTENRANLSLRFAEGRGVLRGTVSADQGRYKQEVDIENFLELIREKMGKSGKPETQEGYSAAGEWLTLDVRMETASPVEVDIKLLQGTATGNLHLRGTAARPVLSGRLEFIEGTIVYRGQMFEVTSGSIGFFNPSRIEPAFDFTARTEITGLDRNGLVTDYIVDLVARGVPDKFQLDLLSSPALSEIDIISLLTWGAVGEQAFATRGGLSSAEAALLLTRELRGTLETGVKELTGFDRVTINPSAVTSTGERTTRIQLDKKLSESFYLTYSTPVLTSEEQEVLLKYRVSDSFSLIGQQKGEEEFGFDLDFQFQIP